MWGWITAILVIAVPVWTVPGKIHQFWHEWLKGKKLRDYPKLIRDNKFEILKTGVCGWLTPYLHWRWNRNKPKARSMRGTGSTHLKKTA